MTMQGKQFDTVAAFAAAEGITTQAAYKRLRKLPSTQAGGCTVFTAPDGSSFSVKKYGGSSSSRVEKPAPVDNQLPTSLQPVTNQVDNQLPTSLQPTTVAALLEPLQVECDKRVAALREQYEARLAEKDARIEELRRDAETWRTAFEGAQALHAGTLQKQLADSSADRADDTVRQSWLMRIMRKNK